MEVKKYLKIVHKALLGSSPQLDLHTIIFEFQLQHRLIKKVWILYFHRIKLLLCEEGFWGEKPCTRPFLRTLLAVYSGGWHEQRKSLHTGGRPQCGKIPCVIIPEVIKELKIEKNIWKWDQPRHCFSFLSWAFFPLLQFHLILQDFISLTVYFPASVPLYHVIQACSTMFPSFPSAADLSGSSLYHRLLDFMLSTAARHSNNRL